LGDGLRNVDRLNFFVGLLVLMLGPLRCAGTKRASGGKNRNRAARSHAQSGTQGW
jgi:hypothetical protein